jgi:hypothetical protein
MGVSSMPSGLGCVCCSGIRATIGGTLRAGDTMDVQTASGLVVQGDTSTYGIAD